MVVSGNMYMMHEHNRAQPGRLGYWRLRLAATANVALAVMVIAALAAVLPVSSASALNPRPHCGQCRRYSDTTPARFQAYVTKGRRTKTIDACSLFCLFEQLEDFAEEPTGVFVTDYTILGDSDALPQRADRMHYVFDSPEGDDEKTNAPYTYAFATAAAAEDFAEEFGGEFLSWEDAAARTVELTDAWEPEKPTVDSTADPYRKQRH